MPPLTLLPLLLWLPDDATLFTVSAVTGCIECGRSPKTPCSSAGSMVLPNSQHAHRPPPGPLALPGSPKHRKKPSAALAAADQQVDKSSSKNSCIASSGVTGRSLVSSAAPGPSEAPQRRETQEECPWPSGVHCHHHKSTSKARGLEQPQNVSVYLFLASPLLPRPLDSPERYLASLGTRTACHRVPGIRF